MTASPFAAAAEHFRPRVLEPWRRDSQSFAEHLTAFGEQPRHQHTNYQQLIADVLEPGIQAQQDWANGRPPKECAQVRATISIGPQLGKSTILHYFMAHWHHELPNTRIIFGTYNATFARTHSKWERDLWRSSTDPDDETVPDLGLRLDNTSQASDEWNFSTAGGRRATGGMIAVGRGGSATGRTAHLVVVDDPFKNMAEAESPVIREQVWTWFITGLMSRIRPVSTIVALHTRWHEDDLIGRLQRDQPHVWQNIALPAIARANDPLGRAVGEPLMRGNELSVEFFESQRRAFGPRMYAALYDQDPQPLQGLLFSGEAFRRNTMTLRDGQWHDAEGQPGDGPPPLTRVVEAVDPAFSDQPDADETGRIVIGVDSTGHGHLLADLSERRAYDDPQWTLGSSHAAHGTGKVVIEQNLLGSRVVSTVRRQLAEHGLQHVSVEGVRAKGTKAQRAEAIANLVDNDQITVWETVLGQYDRLISQCLGYLPSDPESPDRMDAFVHGATFLMLKSLPAQVTPLRRPAELPDAPARVGSTLPSRRGMVGGRGIRGGL